MTNIDLYNNSVIVGIATSYPITMRIMKLAKSTTGPVTITFTGVWRLQDYTYRLQEFTAGHFIPMYFDFPDATFLSGMFFVERVTIIKENTYCTMEATVRHDGDLPGGI